MILTSRIPSDENWNRFVSQGLCIWNEDKQTNVTSTFDKLCKKYGESYIHYLEIQYRVHKEHSAYTMEQLRKWNGNPPEQFFNRFN